MTNQGSIRISDTELLDDLRRTAQLDKGMLTTRLYVACGNHTLSLVKRRFGSWSRAVRLSGLQLVRCKGSQLLLSEGGEVKPSEFAGPATCLKCGGMFASWDRKKNRVCEPCKNTVEWAIPGFYPPFKDER